MKKILLSLIILLFLISPICQSLKVSSETNNISFIAGCTYTFNVTLTPDNGNTFISIVPEITPDGEGITVTYNPNNFLLTETTNVTVSIQSAINLVPITYTIYSNIYYEEYGFEKKDKHTIYASGTRGIVEEEDDDEEEEEDDIPEDNDNETIINGNDTIVHENDYKPFDYSGLMIPSIIVIVAVIIGMFILHMIRKKKKEVN